MLASRRIHAQAASCENKVNTAALFSTTGGFQAGANTGDDQMSEMHIQQLPSMKPVSLDGAATADAGKARFGGHAPSLPMVRVSSEAVADAGKVRAGGHAPSLPPVRLSADVAADAGKVRFGGHAPSLPR